MALKQHAWLHGSPIAEAIRSIKFLREHSVQRTESIQMVLETATASLQQPVDGDGGKSTPLADFQSLHTAIDGIQTAAGSSSSPS